MSIAAGEKGQSRKWRANTKAERSGLDRCPWRGTSGGMSKIDATTPKPPKKPRARPQPTTPAPSPLHYFDQVKRVWRLRNGNRKHDPAAFALEREEMKIAASIRPRVSKPTRPLNLKTMTQLIEDLPYSVGGVVIPLTPPPTAYLAAAQGYAQSEQRLRDTGLDEVLALLAEGHSQREVCARIGTRPAHLNRWLESIEGGESRLRDARKKAAQAWIDRGLAVLQDAETPMDLAKARELAMMCRKYATICDPAYSDRVQVDTTVRAADPESIDAQLRLIQAEVTKTQLIDKESTQ